MQLPELHVIPAGHCAPAPQRQVPSMEQVSATVESHVVQVPPPTPQAAGRLPLLQVFPAQQPEQLLGSHTQFPPMQCAPTAHWEVAPQRHEPSAAQLSARVALQAMQEPPGAPQRATVVGLTQLFELQQPVGQLVESQTQFPPLHRCPAAH
jgi:hypothetical protein